MIPEPLQFLLAIEGVIFLLFLAIACICSAFDEEGRQARLRARYEQELIRLSEEAELCRAQVAVIQANMHYDQVQSRVQYLRSLSKRERGLLEARLRASAEAEAQALYQLNQLEAENYRLKRQLGALTWDGRQ